MEIKNIGGFQPVNDAKNKPEKLEDAPVSFLEYMQRRMQETDAKTAATGGNTPVGALYRANEIEAVAARSRIVQSSGGDVTDFLGLVSKQSFLLGGADLSGLDETPPVARALSQADLQSLREKYDTDNLSPDKQLELIKELAGLGAVTKSDAQKLGLSVSPDEDDLMGYLTKEPGFANVSAIDGNKPKARLEAMLQNERLAYNHVQQRYGKRAAAASELADSHKRVLDTLKQI